LSDKQTHLVKQTKAEGLMHTSRSAAIEAAESLYDNGTFLDHLSDLVSVPTESNPPDHRADLVRYCGHVLGPMVERLGFTTAILDNPDPRHGPVMLATRIEDPAFPTIPALRPRRRRPRHAGAVAARS